MTQVGGEVVSRHTKDSVFQETKELMLWGLINGFTETPYRNFDNAITKLYILVDVSNASADLKNGFCDGLIAALTERRQPAESTKSQSIDILSILDPEEKEAVQLVLDMVERYELWKKGKVPGLKADFLALAFTSLELAAKAQGGILLCVFNAAMKATDIRKELFPTWTAST